MQLCNVLITFMEPNYLSLKCHKDTIYQHQSCVYSPTTRSRFSLAVEVNYSNRRSKVVIFCKFLSIKVLAPVRHIYSLAPKLLEQDKNIPVDTRCWSLAFIADSFLLCKYPFVHKLFWGNDWLQQRIGTCI